MKPPIGIFSDAHVHNWSAFSQILPNGENSRLRIILDELYAAAQDMYAQGCKRMYCAGDLFHVRGSITPSVLNPTLDTFRKICELMEVRIIPGNHDLESDDSKELTNATHALKGLGCVVVTEPTYFEDDDVLMVPWEPELSKLKDKLRYYYAEYEPETAIIHAALNKVIPGIPDHGLDDKELAGIGYKYILCGHYHNRVSFENGVWSIGALTHQTWGDTNTQAGYLIKKGSSIEAHDTNAPQFVDFPDEKEDEATLHHLCFGNYVRVKLGEATEKEIQAVRESISSEYEPAALTIHATPKKVTSERKASIKAGGSLEASVTEYIGHSETGVDKDELARECADILANTDVEEEA